MNRKRFPFSNGIIIFIFLLLFFLYFAGRDIWPYAPTCWAADGNSDSETMVKLHYSRGVQFYKQGKYDKAIDELESVLYIDAKHKKAKKYLAAAIQKKNKETVKQLYKEADGYYSANQYQKALDTYQKVLEVMPGDKYSSYQIELLKPKIEAAEKAKSRTKHKELREELDRFSKEDKEEKETAQKAQALDEMRSEKDKVKKEAQKKEEAKQQAELKEEKKKSSVEKELGVIEDLMVEEKDLSIKQEESNKEEIKETESLYNSAKKHYDQKNYPKAILVFQQVIDKEKDSKVVYTPYAKSYIVKAETKMQEQMRKEESEKTTNEIKSLYSSAKKYYSKGDYPMAISVFKQLIEQEKNFKTIYTPYAMDYIAKAETKMQEQMQSEKEKAKKEAQEKEVTRQQPELKEEKKKSSVEKDLGRIENLMVEEKSVYGKQEESGEEEIEETGQVTKVVVSRGREKEKKYREREKARQVKALFVSGKRYYGEENYYEAIATFQDVIDQEQDFKIVYTPYAEDYIEAAEKILQTQLRKGRLKQVEDIEDKMIDKVIDAAMVSPEQTLGTEIKSVAAAATQPKSDIQQKLVILVNMDFQDVDVVYILDYLADTTGVNIVMSNSVTKNKQTVSIRVKDMALEEALKYVLKSAGLTFRIDKNVIWIATHQEINSEEMETKIFTLKKGKGTFTTFTSPSTGGVSLGSAADIEEVTTIKDVVEKAISWPSGSKIVLDERLGALIVTNTPYNLEMIERILEKIDVEPLQILIEARFVEVTVTDLSELGIDWRLNSDLPIDKTKVGMVQGIASGSGTNFIDTSRQTEGFNLTYQGVLTKPQFQAIIHALEESQKVKTLSAPRVTTLDNQMATMKVVDEWIYPTRYEFQIVQNDTNGDGDFNDADETQYKNVPADFVKRDVGILLRVTPSVGMEDETITLTLIPEVSEGTAGYFSYTGDVTLPLFTSRNVSTSVVVNNGDTVVLGGLMKESQTKVETKVPFLGDLPFVGSLFRKDTESTTRKNLLIFVTASIISSSGKSVTLSRVEK